MRRLSALFIALALVVTLVPLAGPAGAVGTFDDDDGNIHESAIENIAALGITLGCNPPANTLYCPDDYVTRQQMASFLVRTFDLPPGPDGQFTDTAGSVHENDINALAASGITRGCNPPANTEYCPTDRVTRGQMAAFMARGLGLDNVSDPDFFSDDDDNIFEGQINAIARVGITRGCNPPANTEYCPQNPVRRDEMASFLSRVAAIVTTGTTTTTTPASTTSTTTTTMPTTTTSLPGNTDLVTADGLALGTDTDTPQTRSVTLENQSGQSVTVQSAVITGGDASHFSVDDDGLPTVLVDGASLDLEVTFEPSVPTEDSTEDNNTALLLDDATLTISSSLGSEPVPLFGLAHNAINNHLNEPPLQLVFDALGYQVEVGWDELSGPAPGVHDPGGTGCGDIRQGRLGTGDGDRRGAILGPRPVPAGLVSGRQWSEPHDRRHP
jgi:hypothetical protein